MNSKLKECVIDAVNKLIDPVLVLLIALGVVMLAALAVVTAAFFFKVLIEPGLYVRAFVFIAGIFALGGILWQTDWTRLEKCVGIEE